METGLKGKKCLVTGGNSGIGLGIAKALAAEGVDLAIAAIDDFPESLNQLSALGGKVVFLKVDVGQELEATSMVHWALDALGGLDLFVNNAAVARHQPVTKITSDVFYTTINTNLAGCIWAGREVARHMISQRSGSILITGSTVRFCPAYGEASYRISKMGLKMYMETLAIELAPFGIRVNMLTPGHHPTRLTTEMPSHLKVKVLGEIPMRRVGDPDGCGPPAVFLLSDRLSGYTTGSDILVDGGLSLRPLPLRTDEEISAMNLP
jgi:3-oxoacyl-[acyl-carrier protein] reductase